MGVVGGWGVVTIAYVLIIILSNGMARTSGYQNLAACQAALPLEVAATIRITHLSVVSSECHPVATTGGQKAPGQ